jgi:hypothetical protein
MFVMPIASLEEFRRVLQHDKVFPFNGIVLATEEDEQYTYFSSFPRELHAATGKNLRLFVLVGSEQSAPVAPKAMHDLLSVAAESGSAEAYPVARYLKINLGEMPCLALFVGVPRNRQDVLIVRLPERKALPGFVRRVCDVLDRCSVHPQNERLTEVEQMLHLGTILSIVRAPLADILERMLGPRTAGLLDAVPHR